MQEVFERSGGKIRLWPATLYGTLKRLSTEKLELDAKGSGKGEGPKGGSLDLEYEGTMVLDRASHRFRPTCRAQLGQNVAHVEVHCRSGYHKPAGDGRVAESLHQKHQHFAFARAEVFA